MTAQCSAPPSDPANSAFLRQSLIPRIDRSTVLLSSSIRPSSMKRVSPCQRERAYRMASASLIFWLMRASLARNQASKASARGRLFCCRNEATFLGAAAADLLLDRIECGDVLQRLARDRSGTGCREFVEVAPHVHPAEGELDRLIDDSLH